MRDTKPKTTGTTNTSIEIEARRSGQKQASAAKLDETRD